MRPDRAAQPESGSPWRSLPLRTPHQRCDRSCVVHEIEHFFTLDEDELASVRKRRGPLNRLALVLQVGFLKSGTLSRVP